MGLSTMFSPALLTFKTCSGYFVIQTRQLAGKPGVFFLQVYPMLLFPDQ
jgi:hypothetical protein